jgi:hypothetical protein
MHTSATKQKPALTSLRFTRTSVVMRPRKRRRRLERLMHVVRFSVRRQRFTTNAHAESSVTFTPLNAAISASVATNSFAKACSTFAVGTP